MSDWEEFQEIERDEPFLYYNVYRLETEWVDHPEQRMSYQTLKIVEGDNLLWWKGEGWQKERAILNQARRERAEGKAQIFWHYRKKMKILCPHTNKWSDVDPALLI